MIMRIPIILLFLFIELGFSLKWPFSSSSSSVVTRESGALDYSATELSISQLEKDAVFQNLDMIDTFKSTSDCFRDAFGHLKLRCEEIESSQDDRIEAAIYMSLCEIQTTEHVPIPMECRPFVRSLSSTVQSAKSCVEALYRSPQLWSSYSGYLRQIPQLCFAYRRWHDIDTAKRIYQNATLEKIALLRLIKHRQEEFRVQESKLFDDLEHLDTIGGKLELAVESFGTKINVVLDGLHGSWQEAQNDVFHMKERTKQVIDEQVRAHREQLSLVVVHVEEQHANALHSLLADMSHSLALAKASLSDLSSHAESLSITTKVAEAEWPKLRAGVITFTNTLVSVNNAMERIAAKMEYQASVVDDLASRQESMAHQLESLSQSISHISVAAMEHIEEMNATALAMRQGFLLSNRGSPLAWIMRGLVHLLPFLDQFALVSSHELSSYAASRIVLLASRLIWSCLFPVISFFGTSFFVFVSTRLVLRNSAEPQRGPRRFLLGIFSSKPSSNKPTRPSRITFSDTLLPSGRQAHGKPSHLRSSRLATRAVSAPPLGML